MKDPVEPGDGHGLTDVDPVNPGYRQLTIGQLVPHPGKLVRGEPLVRVPHPWSQHIMWSLTTGHHYLREPGSASQSPPGLWH